MKTTKRFDEAVSKLYTAFHEGTLNAMDCKACAVGNMCDNTREWAYNNFKTNTGYSALELKNIEGIFMNGAKPNYTGYFDFDDAFVGIGAHGWSAEFVNSKNKDLVFFALCKVIEYLCELDNIPNVMDYAKLFETENEQPKYQLA
ncbi:MAG: Na(+)-translocating NADH-quinone reductase subunit F [Bacteroidota bacterium]